MPFYEVIYETGNVSVAEADSDTEMLEGVKAQHDRAVAGEAGGVVPLAERGHVAMRVVKVLKYDKHPNDYNADQTMSAEVLKKQLSDLVKEVEDENGVVSVPELAARVRDLTAPTVDSAVHESNFKMKEAKELTLPWL